MLEKPAFPDGKIVICLHAGYGLSVEQITFLPIGADENTAVYRIITTDQTHYFLKLRSGHFDETSVMLPKLLSDQGIQQIIPPLPTKTGQLWGNLGAFKTILYPFIDGKNGYEVTLQAQHWAEFGASLKSIHRVRLPSSLIRKIRQETYSPKWRNRVNYFLSRPEPTSYPDAIATEVAAFLQDKHGELVDLVQRANHLAKMLSAQPPEYIVCHSDLHAGNILIERDGALYIVDWDEPILAPKERDLMYIGGALLASGRTPQEEETLFYQAYGDTQIDQAALAYYRYERIIEDIAIYCEQLLLTDKGGEDRAQSLVYLRSNFLPNHTIEVAYQSDKSGI